MDMPLLATVWWPGLNPFGLASILAVTMVACAWLLAEFPARPEWRAPVLMVSLVLFSGFLVVSAADLVALAPLQLRIKYKRFPDLDDYLANWLVLAVGINFGVRLRRFGFAPRVFGTMIIVLYVAIILAEFCGMVYWRYAG
jgi:hypothetical protein